MKKKIQPIQRKTHVIDARGQSLGRLASRIAILLQGKNKAIYQRHIDSGDAVAVQHVSAVQVTGQKEEQKRYYHYSGYPGGMKEKKYAELFKKDPADVLRRSVLHMLPTTRLRKGMMARLTIEN
ncbi:50S ribosomal protein L13 [Candidatus Uhrbacteria bacterium]|nr:50S ribosomal protein L13 [Candidatus Uhrbacteria bacterium]